MDIFVGREYEPPEPESGAIAAVKAVAGLAVPGGSELLALLIGPSLEVRQREWCEDIAAAIRRLESEKDVDIDALCKSDAFIDALLAASHAAIRTSQKDKRHALRNAVVNSALPGAPEIALQQMFIGLVDRFTEWHLRILKLFHNPATWQDPVDGHTLSGMSSLIGIIRLAYPELAKHEAFCNVAWDDMRTAGLHSTGMLQTMMTSGGTMTGRTSDLGNQFLAFIGEPFE